MNGFIPIRRSLFDHFLFKENRVFSRFEAWLDLIQMATFQEENAQMVKGKLIVCKRGQLVASIRFLQERWNWKSMHKVIDYLELLRSQNMLSLDKENGVSKITLINFEKHNSIVAPNAEGNSKGNRKKRNSIEFGENEGTQKGTQKGTVGEQSGNSEGTNINKDNKGNNGNDIGADAPTYTQEEKDLFKNFQTWIEKNAPRVNKLSKPLTIDEYISLRKKVPKEVLVKVLNAMQNRADLLKRYVSAYLTILNWSAREETNLKPEHTHVSNINEQLKNAGKKQEV